MDSTREKFKASTFMKLVSTSSFQFPGPRVEDQNEIAIEVKVNLVKENKEPQELCRDPEDQHILEELQPVFRENLLSALREHIFNTMPIRLLCFEQRARGARIKITLLEREAVYERLASTLPEEMRKLKQDQEAMEDLISKSTRYAILSHTWLHTGSTEVTYRDWNRKFRLRDMNDPGHQKLVNFCKVAWTEHGLAFAWMDTVCIDKQSSSELDESIRSMYNWYRRSHVCIVYLSNTQTLETMHTDVWFTRGWTLQELLAPYSVTFYDRNWAKIGKLNKGKFVYSLEDKDNDSYIWEQIVTAMKISKDEFNSIHSASISRRMELAANRKVTRSEDTTYSLMGIFGVTISTAYGEGPEHAFFRLLQEILLSSGSVLDIFNWAGMLPDAASRPHISRILPSSPQFYLHRSSDENLSQGRPFAPLRLTHLGLRIPVVLMPALSIIQEAASPYQPFGSYGGTVSISPAGHYHEIPTTFNLLDNRISGPDGWREGGIWHQITLAVYSFGGDSTAVRIPKTCIAIGLNCSEDAGKVTKFGAFYTIQTNMPIVFKLNRISVDELNTEECYYWSGKPAYRVEVNDLKKHGMQLVNLVL